MSKEYLVIGWGWYYLSTIMDDYSRYILAWKLYASMTANDVIETLDMARTRTGIDRLLVHHKPRLLSDNGPCYLSKDLKVYLKDRGMKHISCARYHPQIQRKIERYHRSMKDVINLQYYYLSGDLEREIVRFVQYYNNRRYHESLDNLTPTDVYFGKKRERLSVSNLIKHETLKIRRAYDFWKRCLKKQLQFVKTTP